MPLPDPTDDLMSSFDQINRERQRRSAGVGRAVEEGGRMFEVSEGDRARQDKRIQERSYLDPVIKTRFKSKLADINKWSGLPAMTEQQLEEAASGARHENYVSVDADWERLMGAQVQRENRRAAAGAKAPDIGEIISREEQAASAMLEVGAVDPGTGRKRPVSPVQIRLAAGARLARTYPKQFPVTAALYRQMEVARQQGGDMGAINHAKTILADPKKRAALEQDPYAMRALTGFIEAEPIVKGSPMVPGQSWLAKAFTFKENEVDDIPAVPGQPLPLN